MRNRVFLLGVTCAALFSPLAPAASLLSLDEAIRLAVDRNFGLSLSRDQSQVAANAREGGRGAFLPSASANVATKGPLEGGSPTTTVGASADWEIFNGFRDRNAYRRLQSQEKSASLQERLDLESLLETVLVSYYDIVQAKQRLQSIAEVMAVSGDRARLAQAKLEVGAGSRLEQLQALADLNQDSSSWLDQNLSLERSKVRLNQVLARDAAEEFDVADSIPLSDTLPIEAWKSGLLDRNTSVALTRAQKDAANAGLAEARGRWLPSVQANVNYSAQPSALNAGVGYDGGGYGISLSLPLFDRLATPTTVKQALINLRSGTTRVAQAESQAAADFEVARRQYASDRRRIALEARNLEVARMQAEAARERYKLGASSPLEFRDAQTRFLDAAGRLITARQSAKQAEAALLRLSGDLVRAGGAPVGAAPTAGGK